MLKICTRKATVKHSTADFDERKIGYYWLPFTMNSFQANVVSRGYHVYKDSEWKPIYVNQLITVSKEINATSMQHDL